MENYGRYEAGMFKRNTGDDTVYCIYHTFADGNVYDVTKNGKHIRYAHMENGKLVADCKCWEYVEVK